MKNYAENEKMLKMQKNQASDWTEFYRDKNAKDGHMCRCKECRNEATKNYQKAHPEKVKTISKKCREKDPEKYRLKSKKWREANPEKVRGYGKKRYDKKRERYVDAFDSYLEYLRYEVP